MLQKLSSFKRMYSERITPARVKRKVGATADRWLALLATAAPGRKVHYCNSCTRDVARFHRFGPFTLVCPLCGSTDRERLLIAALDNGSLPSPDQGAKVLHVAPGEVGLAARLDRSSTLTKGDLDPERYGDGTKRIDLMDMADAGHYDIVVLSHVLEHVPDDRRALKEVFSSLKSNGKAWIQVPLIYRTTIEADPSLTPDERDRHFGGSDHVRAYGPDISMRLVDAGFFVETINTNDIRPEEREKLGLLSDTIFVATRPAPDEPA